MNRHAVVTGFAIKTTTPACVSLGGLETIVQAKRRGARTIARMPLRLSAGFVPLTQESAPALKVGQATIAVKSPAPRIALITASATTSSDNASAMPGFRVWTAPGKLALGTVTEMVCVTNSRAPAHATRVSMEDRVWSSTVSSMTAMAVECATQRLVNVSAITLSLVYLVRSVNVQGMAIVTIAVSAMATLGNASVRAHTSESAARKPSVLDQIVAGVRRRGNVTTQLENAPV